MLGDWLESALSKSWQKFQNCEKLLFYMVMLWLLRSADYNFWVILTLSIVVHHSFHIAYNTEIKVYDLKFHTSHGNYSKAKNSRILSKLRPDFVQGHRP